MIMFLVGVATTFAISASVFAFLVLRTRFTDSRGMAIED